MGTQFSVHQRMDKWTAICSKSLWHSHILPIPDTTWIKAALKPAIPDSIIKKGHWYLALHQGTQYAVIAVNTTEGKQLFSKLMRESPIFNHIIRILIGNKQYNFGIMIMLIAKQSFTKYVLHLVS